MNSVYQDILALTDKGEKGLAILIDPDKVLAEEIPRFIEMIDASTATHIFVGGSQVDGNATDTIVQEIKK